MKPTAKRLLAGFLSFCLLLVLYGCSDAFPTLNDRLAVDAIDRTPISYEPDGTTATESSESTEATGESTEPSESTTEPTTTVTDPPPPPDQSVWRDPAKDTPGVVDMTDDEWNEYEEDDPQFPPVQTEPAPPVEDTLPPVSPPPPSDTTSTTEAATATQTTAPSETTGSSAPAPDTTVGTTSGSSSTPESGADSTASTGSSGSGPSSGSSSGSAPETTTTPTETTTTVPKPYTGWYSENGKTYFFNGGSPVTGWQTMGGVRYYFDDGGALSSKVGIDVSTYQGVIDWNAVKASGVEFAFIRAGFRGYGAAGTLRTDAYFERNIKGAIAAGIDCGVYFYSQAITTSEAIQEAHYVLNLIKGYRLTYPVAFDTEYLNVPDARTNTAGLTTQDRTNFAAAFCKTIRDAGYYPMIYANKSWLENNLYMDQLTQYDVWMAQYSSAATYKRPYTIWQYTSTGAVGGIRGNVDRNVGLVDYAAIIRRDGWNHL